MTSNGNGSPPEGSPRPRRGSFTAQTFGNLFGRSNSTSGAPTAPFPGAISISTSQDANRRRMSISTLGLSGASPTQVSPFPFGARRASISTAGSDSIDENAIDDEEGPSRSTPVTPFIRRISFGGQALRNARSGGNGSHSPNAQGRTPPSNSTISSRERSGSKGGQGTPPGTFSSSQASNTSKPRTASNLPSTRPAEGTGFNWSEQLRSRAESSVSHSHRPSLSTSPSNRANKNPAAHEHAKSISDMPTPPAATIPPPQPQQQPARPSRRQPDAFQERILKGDFYMD
ncbi:hypothetical protein F5884DRAFT_177230 [Xylogone sp. PMI_703]|nr:hypothetical protein F5884DRAFT_177230 [Xylogone sp. PMI_703]